MMGLWIALVWLMWVSVSPALADVYRWTDDAGNVHLTDNPDTIPPAYRARARASGVSAPAAPSRGAVGAFHEPPRHQSPALSIASRSFLISSGDSCGRATLIVSLLNLAVSGNGGW